MVELCTLRTSRPRTAYAAMVNVRRLLSHRAAFSAFLATLFDHLGYEPPGDVLRAIR